MKISLKESKNNEVEMDITIPATQAMDAYNQAVKRISEYVNIDGFRKGKAPRPLVEQQVGVERIKIEAIEVLMPVVIPQAIAESKLDVVAQPSVNSFDFEFGSDMRLGVTLQTRPEVTLAKYKGLNLKVEEALIPEGSETKSIENLLGQHSTMEPVSGRAALATDTAVIDFDGSVNGEKIDGGEGKNYALDLGNSNFIPGFAEQIVGHNTGEVFDIEVMFPADYHDEKLKGQKAVFKITIHEIKLKKTPELNDEFAQKVGPFKTVDELKADIKKYLENQKEKTNRQNIENEIFKTVIEASKVDIPEKMIEKETESLLADYKQRLSYQGIAWETLVKAQGEDHLMVTLKEDAQNRIKNSLVIDKIAKAESIKLEQKDLEKKFAEMSAMYGVSQEEIIKQLSQTPDMLSSISQQAMNDKIRDFLVENNKVEVTAPKKS